jgi:glutamate synthase (NADPH/NADH) small chain
METVPDSEFTLDVELVLLAMGFLGPVRQGMLEELGVELTERGNVASRGYATSVPRVYAAGDMRRGQSLVVWAIAEGREAAAQIDRELRAEALLHEQRA